MCWALHFFAALNESFRSSVEWAHIFVFAALSNAHALWAVVKYSLPLKRQLTLLTSLFCIYLLFLYAQLFATQTKEIYFLFWLIQAYACQLLLRGKIIRWLRIFDHKKYAIRFGCSRCAGFMLQILLYPKTVASIYRNSLYKKWNFNCLHLACRLAAESFKTGNFVKK